MARRRIDINPQDLINAYNQKLEYKEIRRRFNCSNQYILKLLKKFNVKHLNLNNRPKLSPEQEKEVIDLYYKKIPLKEICKKFGICSETIRNSIEKYGYKLQKRGQGKRKFSFNNNFFDTLTPESLWVLGWIYSDGDVDKKENRLCITVQRGDREVLLKIAKLMSFDGPLREVEDNRSRFIISSRPLVQKLKTLGVYNNKSLTIKYPDFLTEEWQHKFFIRGVFEGDGCIYKSSSRTYCAQIASGSKDFLDELIKILQKYLNIHVNQYKMKISIDRRSDSIKFFNWIYENENASLYLERKYQKYLHSCRVVNNPPRMVNYWFISPDNKIYHVKYLKRFRDHFNLGCDGLCHVQSGKYKQHKGWRRYSIEELGEPTNYQIIT